MYTHVLFIARSRWHQLRCSGLRCSVIEVTQSAYVSIRQHTSAYVSIRQHTSLRCSVIKVHRTQRSEELTLPAIVELCKAPIFGR
jgi:hypothetical protein